VDGWEIELAPAAVSVQQLQIDVAMDLEQAWQVELLAMVSDWLQCCEVRQNVQVSG
jgi:hypothetical protein